MSILFAGIFFSMRRSSQALLIIALTIFTSIAPLFFYHPHTSRAAIDHVQALYRESQIDQNVVMPVMPALTDFLVRSTQFGDHEEERVPYQLGLLMPNTQALLGIHSIDFYQPIQTSRMGRLLAALGSDSAPAPDSERLALQNIPLDEKIRTIAKRTKLLSALGVTYVVSAQELPEPFVKVESIRPVSRLPEIGVYSSPTGGGLFSVPFNVRVMKPNEDEMVRILTTESDDVALVECMHCDVLPAENLLSYMGTLKQDPTFVSATVTVNQDAWLSRFTGSMGSTLIQTMFSRDWPMPSLKTISSWMAHSSPTMRLTAEGRSRSKLLSTTKSYAECTTQITLGTNYPPLKSMKLANCMKTTAGNSNGSQCTFMCIIAPSFFTPSFRDG
jgi:hypothetical protein